LAALCGEAALATESAPNQLHKGLERLCQNAETQRRRDHDMSVCAKGLTSKSVLDAA